MKTSILTKSQTKKFITEGFRIDGGHGKLIVKVRYDDCCNNGYNSFAITADLFRDGKEWSGGCLHDEIAEQMPELAHLIKWHHMSSNEPMHYISNTLYHSRDTDSDGLKAGEYSAYKLLVVSDDIADLPVTLYTSDTMYTNKQNNPNFSKINEREAFKINDFKNSLKVNHRIELVNCEYSLSKGKDIDLKVARSCAIWPDATLEQLQDKEALTARLPQLRLDFIDVVESLGMVY